MSMSAALSIANSGVSNIDAQFAVMSQNVANAATPAYSAEIGTQKDINAGGPGLGVKTGPAVLVTDQALAASVIQSNATVSGLTTTQTALQAIDAVLGTPGQGTDVGSLLTNLQDAFSTLQNDPSDQTQQAQVVSTATTLANGINNLSNAYTQQRQAAETDLANAVTSLNTTLGTIGDLNKQIIAATLGGQSTADLDNQRNAAVQTLSGLIDVRTTQQSDGELTVFTPAGLVLPTDGSTFQFTPGSTAPGAYYPGGGLTGVTLNGSDVTGQLQGGEIGADIALRDSILPTDQAELDEFAEGLANRFSAQGLTLFTDGSGSVPSATGTPVQSGYVGFAASIEVNQAVAADPSLVRDGTDAIAGSASGASDFTPNPSGGPAGFTGLITRVLNYTFGGDVQNGVAQPALQTAGLGATGALAAPFSPGASLLEYATNMVSSQAQQSAVTTSNLGTETGLQTSLVSKVGSESGVNLDTEMSNMLTLQNAYGANARIISAIQSMFTQLLDAVQ